MKKLYYLRNRGKSEDGQSIVEFVFVLPIFIFFLAMILDFGWLFYTQLGVENSARNAARVACVEYTRVAYDSTNNRPDVGYSDTGAVTSYSKTYNLDDYKTYLNDSVSVDNSDCSLTDQELRVLRIVNSTVPSNFTDVSVSISYSYDKEYLNDLTVSKYKVSNRSNGDVTVLVSGLHHAITPLVNWEAKKGENRMIRKLRCKAVYKVEANNYVD